MIFPDLPKKRHFWTQQQIDKIYQDADAIMAKMQPAPEAPLGETADQWFHRHFPDQEIPPPVNHDHSVDWDHRSTWEFLLLCAGFIVWVVYWYQLK
jgi:hypothetical protein